MVSRDKGGTFECLKRSHVVDADYKKLTIYPEVKHVSAMFERYSKANGKQPKLAKTPCSPGSLAADAKMEEFLPESMAGIPIPCGNCNVCESGKV